MKLKNRIAAEDLKDVQAWALPSMDGKGDVLPAEAKPNRDPSLGRQPAQTPSEPEPTEEIVAEIVEDVDADSLEYAPMTADELQALTDAAEQEGLAQGRKRGLEQGLEEGRQKGYDEGMIKAQSESSEQLGQQVAQLLQIAEQLVEPIAVQQQGLEHLLVETIAALTKQLVRRELQTDSSNILSVVQQAMAALPVGGQQVTLRVNPDDLALIEAHSEEQHLGWRFVGDASLLPGGCQVSTADSLVDFKVETRLAALLEQFSSGQLHDESVEVPAPQVNEVPAPQVDIETPLVEETAEQSTIDELNANEPTEGIELETEIQSDVVAGLEDTNPSEEVAELEAVSDSTDGDGSGLADGDGSKLADGDTSELADADGSDMSALNEPEVARTSEQEPPNE